MKLLLPTLLSALIVRALSFMGDKNTINEEIMSHGFMPEKESVIQGK